MRSDARKRLNPEHLAHHDPAVCALIEAARAEALAQGWDEGHRGLCRRHGSAPFAACRNPYRVATPAAEATA